MIEMLTRAELVLLRDLLLMAEYGGAGYSPEEVRAVLVSVNKLLYRKKAL